MNSQIEEGSDINIKKNSSIKTLTKSEKKQIGEKK